MDLKQLTVSMMIFAAAGTAAAQPTGGDRGRPLAHALGQLDTDGDRQVSEAEYLDAYLARAERRFDRRDSNGDGLLTDTDLPGESSGAPDGLDRETLRACIADTLGVEPPAVIEPGDRIDALDLDGDGALSLEEVLIRAEAQAFGRFAAIDVDGDGVIIGRELRAALAGAAALRQARRACLEEQATLAGLLEG